MVGTGGLTGELSSVSLDQINGGRILIYWNYVSLLRKADLHGMWHFNV